MPAAAGVIGRRAVRHRGRLSGPRRVVPINTQDVSTSTTHFIVTFNQAVTLEGVPQYRSNGTTLPVSAALTAPNELTLTFASSVASASSLVIPFEDPAIRNATGGYVTAQTLQLP